MCIGIALFLSELPAILADGLADLQRGKVAGELRPETEPELLNEAIFGAIYYRMLLRSAPLTRRFGEELVKQVLRGHRSVPRGGQSD